MSTQKERLLALLEKHATNPRKTFTQEDIALKLCIASPSGVVCHLRDDGVSIDTIEHTRRNGSKYYGYRLSRFC